MSDLQDLGDLSGAIAPERSPKSDVELTVLRVWREVLGVEDAGPDDDFFELGGDSLVATKLVSRLREELDSEVPLLAVFDNPTAAELALELEHA